MIEEYSAAGIIMLITIAMSIIAFQNPKWKDIWILYPWRDYRNGKLYTLLTSGFIHADTTHLAFNMLSYYFFAFHLQDAIGPTAFTIIYLLSIVLSDIPTLLRFKKQPLYRSLGASGGVSAIVFSFIVLTVPYHQNTMLYVFFIPMPAWLFGLLYLAYSFYMSRKGGDSINHDAHFYGALSGIALILILKPEVLKAWLYFMQNILHN